MTMNLQLESLDSIEAPLTDTEVGIIVGVVGSIGFAVGVAIVLT